MLESVGTGSLVGALVIFGGLLVRQLVSGQAATAKRYEDEIKRLNEDRDYWRTRYMELVNK